MPTPKDETQDSISQAESKERWMDARQSEFLYKLSEMLNWAMKDPECGKILEEAHQDMKDKINTDNFLKSLNY